VISTKGCGRARDSWIIAAMNPNLPVSGYLKTERLVYFARMCSKARLMLRGVLPEPYHPYIGTGFDGRCCRFLRVEYADIQRLVAEGKSDAEILDWCYAHGRRPYKRRET